MGARNHMVAGELVGREPLATVLTAMVVAQEHVPSRERQAHLVPPHILDQTNNGWRLKADGHRPQDRLVGPQDLDFAEPGHRHGTLPRNHLERFVRRIQEQRVRMAHLYKATRSCGRGQFQPSRLRRANHTCRVEVPQAPRVAPVVGYLPHQRTAKSVTDSAGNQASPVAVPIALATTLVVAVAVRIDGV